MTGSKKNESLRNPRWIESHAPLYSPPGTLTVSPDAEKSSLTLISYGPDHFEQHPIERPDDVLPCLHQQKVTWLNVDGVGDAAAIRRIGEIFGLHRLALEDVVHVNQRPKVDDFESHLYIVARMIDRSNGQLGTEQLSMFLGKDFVLTFQERPGDCLDAIRLRAKEKRGRIRDVGADYLAYAILDAVVDEYFPVIELEGDRLEELETEVLERPRPGTATRVHKIKRDLLILRRAIWPLREAVNALQRGTTPLVTNDTRIYLRDCYDHAIQILDLIEIYRELCTGVLEMYMTSISHHMNEIMKVLTIISTIFIPLTFIVGLYGMNFHHMPELDEWWGYPAVLAVMAVVAGAMILYFRNKGWLFKAADADTGATPTDRHETPAQPPSSATPHQQS
jgi:magnesium transporter